LREAGYAVTEIDVTSAKFTLPEGIEAVFIALHGTFGEDGGVQECLEEMGIPYAGANAKASQIAFDKILTEQYLCEAQIPFPESEILCHGGTPSIALPVAVKPPRQGSSVGCSLVFEESEWPSALTDALQYDDKVLVQRFIPGREFAIGIVDDEVLPVIEIVTPNGWYDYSAKYQDNTTRYIVPADLDAGKTAELQSLAMQTFNALNCRGFGRVDFRMTLAGEPFVLELNTIPGFTTHSLLPKAAAVAGIPFSALCDRIMQTASLC
jgi:D-alanine-D-alanine ligase